MFALDVTPADQATVSELAPKLHQGLAQAASGPVPDWLAALLAKVGLSPAMTQILISIVQQYGIPAAEMLLKLWLSQSSPAA